MTKRLIISICILIIGGAAYVGFSRYHAEHQPSSSVQEGIIYKNNQYGFSFSLPEDWAGYSIATSTWEGDIFGPSGDTPAERGPIILIRNPKWTAQNPYQDIPIMVFTLRQWDELQQEAFHIGAAPINPSELGRNSVYVFALPARYNFAFLPGWEEVQNILDGHPLTTFSPTSKE